MSKVKPLETFFDIEPDSMEQEEIEFENEIMITQDEQTVAETVQPNAPVISYQDTLDDEDKLISKQTQSVYDKAIAVFHSQQEMVEIVDPRFAARNAEVAAQYLNTALQAVALRARVKTDKDRLRMTTNIGSIINGNVNNNVLVADRNEILKAILNRKIEEE